MNPTSVGQRGLKYIIDLIKVKLKTPKAYQIDIIIDWLNTKQNAKIKKLPLCSLPLQQTAWFAGFLDADGSFGVELSQYKHVACKFRLAQQMYYVTKHCAHTELNNSYKSIMNRIADYLCVRLNIRKQARSGRSYYIISMSSAKSKKILRAYLDQYPLLSSKFLDYKDWCTVDDLMLIKKHYTKQSIAQIGKLKDGMNNSRAYFNWDHLDLCLIA